MNSRIQSAGGEGQFIAEVCRLYYVEELSKSEIADQLDISRFKVADLIKLGREHGIVRIDVVDPTESTRDLEERLVADFGLDRAVVSGNTPTTDLAAVGSAAADLLLGEIHDERLPRRPRASTAPRPAASRRRAAGRRRRRGRAAS